MTFDNRRVICVIYANQCWTVKHVLMLTKLFFGQWHSYFFPVRAFSNIDYAVGSTILHILLYSHSFKEHEANANFCVTSWAKTSKPMDENHKHLMNFISLSVTGRCLCLKFQWTYHETSNIRRTLLCEWNCWSLRCSWSIACRRCYNYIFILDLIPGFNGLDKDNCKTGQETFKVWDLVPLILEIWRYRMCLWRLTQKDTVSRVNESPL